MYFTRKRFCFDAFDGKNVLSAHLDFPTDGEGLIFEYFSVYVKRCLEFVTGKLYDAVKNKYLLEYNVHSFFDRYYYELKINETYAEDELFSYMITVLLKCGTNIVSHNVDSIVFYREMIIPPKLIYRAKNHAVILNAEGKPSYAKFSEGQILIEKLSDKKFFVIK